jgi:hypothetical protein
MVCGGLSLEQRRASLSSRANRLVSDYDQQVTRLRGLVTDIPEVDRGQIRFYLRVQEISGYSAPLPRLARLSWYQDEIVPRSGE